MAAIDASKVKNLLGSRALQSTEWMAENAYIAPGFHRLFTAGGLTLGLWGGRKFMDVATARNTATGETTTREQTSGLVRPLHGVMRYNPYSDEAAERWKFVIDRVAPVALGALAAYAGGKLYFYGNTLGGKPFYSAGGAIRQAFEHGIHSSEVTEGMLRLRQSDATRTWAATTFGEGSATGMHLTGAFSPFNNGMVAVSFQQGAGRNIWLPFSRTLSRALGNYGSSSRYLFSAMRDTAQWMEANIVTFAHADAWAHPEILLRRARDGLQKFPRQSAQAEQTLANSYRALIDDAYAHAASFRHANPHASDAQVSEQVRHFISGAHNPRRGLFGSAHDHLLHDLGFDISNVRLARDPFAFFSRLFGSRPAERALMKNHAEYLNKEFGYTLDPAAWANDQLHMEPWKVAAAYGGSASIIATGLVGASKLGTKLYSESSQTHKPHLEPTSEDPSAPNAAQSKPQKDGNIVDWVNGKPLDVAHWTARALITPPSMHRFMNAAFLSAMLYGGMKLGNVLTGRNLASLTSGKFVKSATGELISESVIERAHVWAPFRSLHGLLAYTPGSAAIQDRWRQAVHYIMPVGVGMFGTYTGSHLYFKDRAAKLSKPDTLEDYADRITLEQSKVYAGATAITSIFNTGSGIHLLPIVNYSSNLHNRFLMGSGMQVAMPGIGKWWSGNAGTTPWGVKLTLQQMSNYLTYNESARPHEMPSLVHSLIGKLYPTLSNEQLLDKKQIILDRIYDLRDHYLVDGKVPASKQETLGATMKAALSGKGFEALLSEAALDPAKADLANNGASGKIANIFGERGTVEQLKAEYRHKYARRSTEISNEKPADFLRGLLDAPKVARVTANDNGQAQSFADKILAQPAQKALLSGKNL